VAGVEVVASSGRDHGSAAPAASPKVKRKVTGSQPSTPLDRVDQWVYRRRPVEGKGHAMQASPGAQILVPGHHVGDPDRHGEVVEVRGEAGQPPYVVRWSDGHEALFIPSSDAIVEPQPAGGNENS
jgi:hypothetical protein